MAREIVSFRLAPEIKRQFFAKLALRGQKAQDFFEQTVQNFIKEDAMTETDSPYILIRKSGEPVARIPVNMDEDSLPAGSPEICEIVRSHGYPCIESELEFLPREREAQGPDTPARVIVDVEEMQAEKED